MSRYLSRSQRAWRTAKEYWFVWLGVVIVLAALTALMFSIFTMTDKPVYSGPEGSCYWEDERVVCRDNDGKEVCRYVLGRDSGHWCGPSNDGKA